MKRLIAAVLLLALAAPAFAHPGHGTGLEAGLIHPFTGIDHMLAMLAVGLWAAQQRSARALWAVPLAFVASMAVGAVAGRLGLQLPAVEAGIAASLLVLGLLVAGALRLPTAAAMGLVGVFALFHGWAHGAEMPAQAGWGGFALGFVVATASLHALGVGLGLLARRHGGLLLRAGGVGVAVAGLWLALN